MIVFSAMPPALMAAWTACSRPKAWASSAAVRGAHISTPEPASRASFPRPCSAPSLAATRTRTLPVVLLARSAASTFSNPATSWPDLRARPSSSATSRLASSTTRSARSGAAFTDCLAALEKACRATAWSRASRVAVTHRPRPGRRSLRSGVTRPSGSITKRIIAGFSSAWRVTMQRRRVGETRTSPSVPASSSSAMAVVACNKAASSPLLLVFALLVLGEPVGARRHDDGVGILEAQLEGLEDAVFLLGQLVGGEVGEVVERLHARLAQRRQHGRRQARNLRHRVLDPQLLALGGQALALGFQPGLGAGL